jgi:hypothetical protein
MPTKPSARFRPVADAALVTGRPHRTIRTWAARNQIDSMTYRGRLLVDLVAAARLSDQAERRSAA